MWLVKDLFLYDLCVTDDDYYMFSSDDDGGYESDFHSDMFGGFSNVFQHSAGIYRPMILPRFHIIMYSIVVLWGWWKYLYAALMD